MNLETVSRWPPILNGPLFASLFFLVALALGFRVLRALRLPTRALDPWEHGFIAVTVGTALLPLVPCALAVIGRLNPASVRVACVLLAIALGPDLVHVVRRAIHVFSNLPSRRISRSAAVWCLLFSLLVGLMLTGALSVGPFGDDDGYHLSAPKRWLTSGDLHYLPTYTHTNASLDFEMLYVIALSFADVVSAKMVHFCAGLFSLSGILLSARRLGSLRAGVTGISFLLIATPIINLPLLFTLAYADFGALWMTTASVLLWLLWCERRNETLFVLLALCAGFAGAFKFTSLAIVVAWAMVLLFSEQTAASTWRQRVARVVAFGVVSIVPVLPWLARNRLVTGNPIYPMFSSVLATRDWSADHAVIFSRYVRYYSWGVAAGVRLGANARKAILLATVASIVATGAVAFAFVRRAALRSLVLFAIIFGVISAALTGLIFRYWLPAIATATLAVAVRLLDYGRLKRWRYWPACVLLVLAVVAAVHQQPRGVLLANARMAIGLSTRDKEYANDYGWQMWRYINSATQAGSRVLAVAFYSRLGASSFGGFWVDRTFYTTDSHLQMYIRLDDWSSFVQSTKDAGITHVLIFEKQEQQGPGRHGFWFREGENEYPFCRRLADEYGEKLVQFGPLQLYRVWPERAGDAAAGQRGAAEVSPP